MNLPTLPLTDLKSIDDVRERLAWFKWKVYDSPAGGRTAFTILGGNKETGELHVLAAIEGGAAPEHEHQDGGPYGELILTISGELEDVTDDGKPIVLRPGEILMHRGASIHAPRAPRFWLGYYHQPRGSRLT